MDENKTKHLDMISATISRMASNCIAIKGLLVTIVTAVLAFKFSDMELKLLLLLLGIMIIFAIFDCYYLLLERKYRRLFDTVRLKKDDEKIDFDMNVKNVKLNIFKMPLSPSIYLFYIPLFVIVLIIYLV